jgi:hypothetical protein
MAFTFASVSDDPITGIQTFSATTNTSSAAGTFYPGFSPRYILVYQETTPAQYEWFEGMTAAYKKTVAAGTVTTETTNGITVKATTSATSGNGPYEVTLGTGIHTNSATFRITCFK